MASELLWAAFGGGCGAALRYGITNWAAQRWSAFPCGTLLVNVLGCFFIGLFMAAVTQRLGMPAFFRPLLVSGFLGGLTTFSSFSYESLQMFLNGAFLQALANIAANLLLCLGAAWGGLAAGRFFAL